jgi:hypothetical protein
MSYAEDALRRLGIDFDPSPPLLDATRPLALGFATRDDGSFVALAALEVEHFLVLEDADPEHDVFDDFARLADVLSRLDQRRSLAHVIATRSEESTDGAALRAGWLVIGRGADARHAARDAEAGLRDLDSIVAAVLGGVTDTRVVTSADALLDLVRPLYSPVVRAIRRAPVRFTAMKAVRLGRGDTDAEPGVSLPWGDAHLLWGPLATALAGTSVHTGLVIRVDTATTLSAAQLATLESATGRAAAAAPESFARALRDRLDGLRDARLAVEVALTADAAIASGLEAIAHAAFSTAFDSRTDEDAHDLPATPVVSIALERSLLDALDAEHDLDRVVTTREAAALVRTSEPPRDERSPLPLTRARIHPQRVPTPDGTEIGDALRHGRWSTARLADEVRFRHVYMVGQTGTGKSTLLHRMITADIAAGHGLTVLDPHGSLVDGVLDQIPKHRADDVVLIDGGDSARVVALNPLRLHSKNPEEYRRERDLAIDDLMDTFDHLYDLRQTGGPMFEKYFRTFTSLLVGTRPPSGYTPTLPMLEATMNDPAVRRRLAATLGDDPITLSSLQSIERAGNDLDLKNMAPYITSKLVRFYSSGAARRMLCQPGALDFDELVAQRKIVLVVLPKALLGPEASTLIARQIVLRLSQACMRRKPTPDAPAHFLYADEFHNFATERFAMLLAEARKFRLGLVLAHQYTSQLVGSRRGETVLDAVLGNVGTLISFRIGAKDAVLLGRSFAPQASEADLSGLPNYTAMTRILGVGSESPFTIKTRAADPGNPQLGKLIRELARYKHARKSVLIDAEINEQLSALAMGED